MCLENDQFMMHLIVSSAVMASFMTLSSLFWFDKDINQSGPAFMIAGVVGTVCIDELFKRNN